MDFKIRSRGFRDLEKPAAAPKSAAGDADLIAVATDSREELPRPVKAWLECAVAQLHDQEAALVAVLGSVNEQEQPESATASYRDEHRAMDRLRKDFARLAPQYDHRWAKYLRITHEQTLRRLQVRPYQRLLDVGCGTGALLEIIAARYPEVALTGVDICDGMLERAHQKLGERAALFRGQAERLPFADDQFDVVVSCSSLHYWQRPLDGLRELSRVLKPQGQMVITDWCRDYVASWVVELFLRVIRHETIQVLGVESCKRLLQTVGCQSIRIERYKIDWFWGMMTASGRLQKKARIQTGSAAPAAAKEGEFLAMGGRGKI